MSTEERVAALETLVGVQGNEIEKLRIEKDRIIKKGLYVLGAGVVGLGVYIWGNHIG